MSGFVVIDREAMSHHIVGEPTRFYAWCYLISNACWKPTKFNIQGKTIVLERGQLCASRSQLATAWGWSPSAVERFLTRLETEQMIGRETGQGRSVITICNYAKYQDVKDRTGQAAGQDAGQRPDSDRTTKEPSNQETIDEEANASPSNTRAPFAKPDWADSQVWSDLKRNRKAKRLPNTATAYTKFLRDLEQWVDDEWPPGRVLEAIVARGWASAQYDPRENQSHGRPAKQSLSPNARRGERRNPCLDMLYAAEAEISSAENPEPDFQARPALRAIGHG